MQVEAIYDQGRIELAQPLHLRHPRVRVLVEVPDEGHAPLLADAPTTARIVAFCARCDGMQARP